jgi:hypothetical protein
MTHAVPPNGSGVAATMRRRAHSTFLKVTNSSRTFTWAAMTALNVAKHGADLYVQRSTKDKSRPPGIAPGGRGLL